ncbi:hypothetical protein C8R47DRAFT_1110516 [Mycena vitilis]|nr:hypothetical protein C8R47DRAFT_1110516 [Mycena vitilis]
MTSVRISMLIRLSACCMTQTASQTARKVVSFFLLTLLRAIQYNPQRKSWSGTLSMSPFRADHSPCARPTTAPLTFDLAVVSHELGECGPTRFPVPRGLLIIYWLPRSLQVPRSPSSSPITRRAPAHGVTICKLPGVSDVRKVASGCRLRCPSRVLYS